jgi:hypothetical protein
VIARDCRGRIAWVVQGKLEAGDMLAEADVVAQVKAPKQTQAAA